MERDPFILLDTMTQCKLISRKVKIEMVIISISMYKKTSSLTLKFFGMRHNTISIIQDIEAKSKRIISTILEQKFGSIDPILSQTRRLSTNFLLKKRAIF